MIFLIGIRCKDCGIKNRKHPKTKTQKEVLDIFTANGCKLESEYINVKSPLKFTCKCGRPGSKSFEGFVKFPACRKCGHEYGVNKTKHSYEKVRSIFVSGNCELLDKTYVNNKTPMRYRCECGNISYIKLTNFLKGIRCEECTAKKRIKYDRDYIKDIIESGECQYVSHERDYSQTRVTIICTCGRTDSVYLPAFFARGKMPHVRKRKLCRKNVW